MAEFFLGLPVGHNEFTQVKVATSSQTTQDIEVRLSATAQLAGITRNDLATALQVISNYIVQGGQAGAGTDLPIL